MKVGIIIQARMGSTRLPGKVMKKIADKTILGHVISRVKQCKLVDEIIIATTTLKKDDIVVNEAAQNNVKWFRGSEDDVLSRYYFAAKDNNLDVIVRITADCPLIDPIVTDEIIKYYIDHNYALVTNAGPDLDKRTYPRGLDTEVFSFTVLTGAYQKANEAYQREHVTPYIYENKSFDIFFYKNDTDYSRYRLTLDTIEDFQLIYLIYKELYHGEHDFYLNDIIRVLKKHPDYYRINQDVEQKKIR